MVEMSVQTRLAETRGRRFVFEVKIRNTSERRLQLVSLSADEARGVTVEATFQPGRMEAENELARLSRELTEIANRTLLQESEAARCDFNGHVEERNRRLEGAAGVLDYAPTIGSSLMSGAARALVRRVGGAPASGAGALGDVSSAQVRDWCRRSSYSVRISNARDASRLLEVLTFEHDEKARQIFQLKLERLEALEGGEDQSEGEPKGSVLDPGAELIRVFAVRVHRARFERLTYPVSFRARLVDEGGQATLSEAHASLEVSASPVILTLLAMAIAMTAASLVAPPAGESGAPETFWSNMAAFFKVETAQLGLAAFTALIAFNSYENMEVMRGVPRVVSWRSALIVGTLAGALTEQVWNAIGAFFT